VDATATGTDKNEISPVAAGEKSLAGVVST
jgi:hypothetical protein